MDINNNLITPVPPRSLQEDRQAKNDVSQRVETQPRSTTSVSPKIDGEQLQRRGEQAQVERVQRLNALDSAPLQTRQALEVYQQSSEALEDPSQGELVGVDLYV